MKYEDWIKYEEARLEEKRQQKIPSMDQLPVAELSFGPEQKIEASYRERCLLEVLLQQQALIDALKAQMASMTPMTASPAH